MLKHAYMIMAHNNFKILQYQLSILDNECNDIFVHIDKKVGNFNFEYYSRIVKKAKLTFVNRISVNWGGYSLIHCEMILLTEATKTYHDYYHLLSGVDLPIKTNKFINDFFTKYKGYEFIDFETDRNIEEYIDRMKYYHFLQENLRKNYNKKWFIKLNYYILRFQKLLKVNRLNEKKLNVKKGSNWFSITHQCAVFVVKYFGKYEKQFKYTCACDEMFIHTILCTEVNNFKYYLHCNCSANVRKIDWVRGRPYTWRNEDYTELLQSSELWARKFDLATDSEIVEKIYHYLIDNN